MKSIETERLILRKWFKVNDLYYNISKEEYFNKIKSM